jgi:hypothetical protein
MAEFDHDGIGSCSPYHTQYTWITQVSYVPPLVLTKIAVLGFFIQVFPARGFRLVCWGTIVYCVLLMVATTMASILTCIPVEAAWTAWTGNVEGVCFENNAFWWAHSVRGTPKMPLQSGRGDAKSHPRP